ncbi:MAG: type VI secretion system protein TssA [Bryobacterales bacterium]|nr:type VI secretion system protein TssA [Bryobacterales bacterium]
MATKSKDLQLAAWLTEALLVRESFAGLAEGLSLCQRMIETFWDSLFPELDPEDLEMRAAPLNWIGMKLDLPLRRAPLVQTGLGYYLYKESRTVGYEAQAKTDAEKKNRQKMLKEGKLAAEDFDKAFEETPKIFYAKAERDLDACLETLTSLHAVCEEKFGGEAPSFSPLEQLLKEIRHTVHALLEKKREKEPDPVEPEREPEAAALEAGTAAAAEPGQAPALASMTFALPASSEPPDRREAVASVAAAAAYLRRQDPLSPAPYLMMRGLRWGELRAAAELSDPTLLEAPPTEIRQTIKRLAVDGKWSELLEAAENVMALPCSRAWLDLQRFVVEACVSLGEQYFPIAKAIRSG